jgi:hypothetical protein
MFVHHGEIGRKHGEIFAPTTKRSQKPTVYFRVLRRTTSLLHPTTSCIYHLDTCSHILTHRSESISRGGGWNRPTICFCLSFDHNYHQSLPLCIKTLFLYFLRFMMIFSNSPEIISHLFRLFRSSFSLRFSSTVRNALVVSSSCALHRPVSFPLAIVFWSYTIVIVVPT